MGYGQNRQNKEVTGDWAIVALFVFNDLPGARHSK
jgi:hypothetical protein